MFGFLKKKGTEKKELANQLYAPVNGKVVSIEEVGDPVFSQKMMGDGYAVIPSDGSIFSPIAGTIASIFPTKHAVGFKMDNGLEILLHMGLDTVELAGAPFEVKVQEGQTVGPETPIANVDLKALADAEKGNDMIVIITNMDAVADFSLTKTGTASAGEVVGQVTTK